ncbi:MAG: hypothetical protein AB7E47_17595 [Desulfovibrionaceae bacterium]
MSRKAVDDEGSASPEQMRARNVLVVAGILLLGLVITFFLVSEKSLRPFTGGVFHAKSEYVTVLDRHSGETVDVPRATLAAMERLVLERRNKVAILHIKLNDTPRDGRITLATPDFVVGVEVEFTSGFRIETRAVRTSGAAFLGEVGRQLDKAMVRYDDMVARGDFRPHSPRKVFLQ